MIGHRRRAPARGEDGGGAAETLIVDEAGVDGEQAHEQEQVAAAEKGPPDLGAGRTVRACPGRAPRDPRLPLPHSASSSLPAGSLPAPWPGRRGT